MIKYKKPDMVAVLRLFHKADDNHGLKDVDQLTLHATDDQSTLVSFRYKKSIYFLLTDHRAHDELSYVEAAIQPFTSSRDGVLLLNPTTTDSYAMPYKGKEVYLYQLPPQKVRLDKELSNRYPNISRSTLQKYIKEGYVTVNSDAVTVSKTEISTGDAISLSIPELTDYSDQSFPIIYIDDDVIVIDKPAGVLTHSKGVLNDEFTVADFFERYSHFASDTNRAGIVHRLDRDTSGVIIGARTEEAAQLLKKQFADRQVEKTYFAVVSGIPKNHEAIIDVPIGRNPSRPSAFSVDPKGKPAVTKYEVVRSSDTKSLVKLSPKTGRTHQLRVHMAYIGTPILGDRVYSKVSADRLYLHAESLRIMIPSSTEPQTFSSKMPQQFNEVVGE